VFVNRFVGVWRRVVDTLCLVLNFTCDRVARTFAEVTFFAIFRKVSTDMVAIGRHVLLCLNRFVDKCFLLARPNPCVLRFVQLDCPSQLVSLDTKLMLSAKVPHDEFTGSHCKK